MAKKGPVVILSRQQPKGILVHPDQWNAMAARLKMLEMIHEARKIEAITNEGGAWIPWEQTKARMKADGNMGD
jgi:PHD/YefM family antitoxin component YafN of YafNO toxin-antitoxin module